MRILVAEDDTVSRTILETALSSLGHQVAAAADGETAWRLLQTGDFDAVVSDRAMPGLDGVELCRRVRALSSGSYVYFIFLTSAKDKRRAAEGMEAGADDYLVKPVDLDELSARLVVARRITNLYHKLDSQQRELVLLNKRLFDLARSDPLTQFGTRLKLREDLALVESSSGRSAGPYCAIMCDVDFFKLYNDTYGHLAGDEVLRRVAAAIKGGMRQHEAGYRYGGEEFLLILPMVALAAAQETAERHRAAVEALKIRHEASPHKLVTISAGIALLPRGPGASLHDWLKAADDALYEAKKLGRNRVGMSGPASVAQAG